MASTASTLGPAGLAKARWGLLFLLVAITTATPAKAATWSDDFSADPTATGWKSFGLPSLFHWNSANRNLEVTWDSSQTNSFFYHPLGTILTTNDDFTFAFDIRLSDIRYGISAGKTDTFEIAVGLFNSRTITNANYFRGSGQNSTYGVKNLVEFDYFPDAGFGATFSSTVVSTNNRIKPAHNFPLEMTPGDLFRLTFTYTATNQILRTSATKNGAPFGLSPGNSLVDLSVSGLPDFRVDSFGISSYSDAIQTGPPNFWGSILAHGTIDNVSATLPPPPVQDLRITQTTPMPAIQFSARTNWIYFLEHSPDLQNWTQTTSTNGRNGIITINDPAANSPALFYRIRAERP